MRPRPVAMGLFVGADGEFRDVTGSGVFGQLKFNVVSPGPALAVIHQLEVAHIRHEVGLPNIARKLKALIVSCMEEPLAVKVTISAIEPVLEREVIVEDEVQVVQEVDHRWRGGDCQAARGFIAAAVKMLVPGIEGSREERARVPLESLLPILAIPYGRSAFAADDIDGLLEEMPLGLKVLSRRDLADVTVIDLPCPLHLKKGATASFALPPLQFYASNILDKEGLDHRHTLGLDPFLVTALSLFFREVGLFL